MKILVIGETCKDVFNYGRVDRLCPEAPVPVFNFYTYYGINPLSELPIGSKQLIGSISLDQDSKKLKLVLEK